MRCHLVAGEQPYKDNVTGDLYQWKKGQRHYVPKPTNRFLDCDPDTCLTCAYTMPAEYGLNVAPDKGLSKLRPGGFCAMSGVIEEWHHLVAFEKSSGEGHYFERMLCTGRGCKWCKDNWAKVFGKRFYHAFNTYQWRTVVEPIMEKVERFCRCGGYIYPVHYVCPHCKDVQVPMTDICPNCGTADPNAIMLHEDTHEAECESCGVIWKLLENEDKELDKMVGNETTCQACREVDYPDVVFACTDPNGTGCQCDPYSIFDIQFRIKKVTGDNNKSSVVIEDNWVVQDLDPRLFDVQNQTTGDETPEQADMPQKIAESFKHALPLDDIFAGTPPDEQAQILNVRNILSEANRGGRRRGGGAQEDTATGIEDDGGGGGDDNGETRTSQRPRYGARRRTAAQ